MSGYAPSFEELEQNPSGRMAEGWNTVTFSRARQQEFKTGVVLIVTWKDQTGAEVDDVFDDQKRNWARLFTLAKIIGIRWTGKIEWTALAKLIESNVVAVDIQVTWGKGDRAYVRTYAPAGSGGGDAEAPAPEYQKPQPAAPVALATDPF